MALGWVLVAGLLRLADPHVRTAVPELGKLLREGIERSETFRSRLERLETSDLVVYVDYDYFPRGGIAGFVTFIATNAGWRYIQIKIAWNLPRRDQIAILGHELQHAMEIAEAAEVIDLFSRLIGADELPQVEPDDVRVLRGVKRGRPEGIVLRYMRRRWR
jgi:hypothetical protein